MIERTFSYKMGLIYDALFFYEALMEFFLEFFSAF